MWEVNTPINTAELDPIMVSRGFLNVCGFLRLADDACEGVFRNIGFGGPRAVASGETVFTAAAHVDVFQPIGSSQGFYSTVTFSELGKKKIITKTHFHGEGGELLAEVETVHVCYDLNRQKTMEVPADIREKVQQSLEL